MPKTTIDVGQQTFTKWERYDKNKALLCFFDAPDALFEKLSTYYTIYHPTLCTEAATVSWAQETQQPFGIVALGEDIAQWGKTWESIDQLTYVIGIGPVVPFAPIKKPMGWITGGEEQQDTPFDFVYSIQKAKEAPHLEHPTLFLMALRQITYQFEQQ